MPESRHVVVDSFAAGLHSHGASFGGPLLSPGSPLYGDDEHRLPGELTKIRHRLRAAGVRSPSDA